MPDRLTRLQKASLFELVIRHSFSAQFMPDRQGDACAARGKVGPVMGLSPLRGPPCIPPEAPPGDFPFPQNDEGTRPVLRELPSLAPLAQAISLRAA